MAARQETESIEQARAKSTSTFTPNDLQVAAPQPLHPSDLVRRATRDRGSLTPGDRTPTSTQYRQSGGTASDEQGRQRNCRNAVSSPLGETRASASGSLRTMTTVVRYPFRAVIRRGPGPKVSNQSFGVSSRSDAAPGEEHGAESYLGLLQQLSTVGAATAGIRRSGDGHSAIVGHRRPVRQRRAPAPRPQTQVPARPKRHPHPPNRLLARTEPRSGYRTSKYRRWPRSKRRTP